MAATKCMKACGCGQEVQLSFRPNVRMGKKGDLSDFDCGLIVDASQGGLSVSETAELLRDPERDNASFKPYPLDCEPRFPAPEVMRNVPI